MLLWTRYAIHLILISVSMMQVSRYKLKPFHRARVCFLGFPDEEKSHMVEILKENGGEPVDLDDSTCTHLVSQHYSCHDTDNFCSC